MQLDFDLGSVQSVEFGVGRDDEDFQEFSRIEADQDVQDALLDMVRETVAQLEELEALGAEFNPAEKYAGREYAHLPLASEYAGPVRDLHTAGNLPADPDALSDSEAVFCYFARLTDSQGRTLTAMRRAAQFKGIVKARLIRLLTEAVRIVEDTVFKLDTDFDLVADSLKVHLLRPTSFEFMAQLQDAVLAAVPANVAEVERQLSYVDFGSIAEYAGTHPRAARYLASIRSQAGIGGVDRRRLSQLCARTGVELTRTRGKLAVQPGHVLGFLEVLDRRRYQLELIVGEQERFRAASRTRLQDG